MNTKFLITALAAGLLIGIAFTGTDILNPTTSVAKANQTNEQTQHQQALDQQTERLTAAQTDAQIQNIQRQQELQDAQLQHKQQVLVQDAINKKQMADTLLTLVNFFGTAMIIVVSLGALMVTVAKAIAILRTIPKSQPVVAPPHSISAAKIVEPLPKHKPSVPVPSSSALFERRLEERLQEIAAQRKEADLLAVCMKSCTDPARMSKGKYNTLPLAGD